MKKLVVLLIMVLMVTACTTDDEMLQTKEVQQATEAKDYDYSKPIELQVSSEIIVFVDPRIEATNLVMEMIKDQTGYSMYNGSEYMATQVENFEGYRDHPIFEMAYEMCASGFSFDAISGNLHSVNEKGELLEGLVIDKNRLSRAGGADQLKEFIKTLNDFRAVSDYDTYFQENKEFYLQELELAQNHIMSVALSEELTNFYGYSLKNIKVCIIPDSMGGFGISNTYQDHVEAIPTLPVYESEVNFISFLVHELSHPYINPQTSLYPELINKSSHLFEPIRNDMANQAYPLWEYCLNEHIVRASTYLIMEQLYNGEYNSKLLASEVDKKFVYIESIIKTLNQYNNHRQQYPDINTYTEVLLNRISELEVHHD